MQTINNKSYTTTSTMLLPPITTDTFTQAVPDLITFFEGLDTTIEELSSSTTPPTIATMSHLPAPFPTPFTALRLSLTTNLHHHPKRTTTTTTTTTSSTSNSPESSLRGAPFPTTTRRSHTWTSPRTASRSRSRSPSATTILLLSRRPSATDLALLEEETLSQHVRGIGLGLGMMEPRPVVPVAVAVAAGSAASSIFEGADEAECEVEARQPFVMGGIAEVLEGRS